MAACLFVCFVFVAVEGGQNKTKTKNNPYRLPHFTENKQRSAGWDNINCILLTMQLKLSRGAKKEGATKSWLPCGN